MKKVLKKKRRIAKKARKSPKKRVLRKKISKKSLKKKTSKKAKKQKKPKRAKSPKRSKKTPKKAAKRPLKKDRKPREKRPKDLIIEGNIVDVISRKIYPGKILIKDGKIFSIEKTVQQYAHYLLPGLVDAHIHIESSMMAPSRFAQAVAPHGTVATVSDPHEIANVLGVKGINYMIRDAKKSPLKIYYTAPSCVPATEFETSGDTIDHDDIDMLLKVPGMVAMGELMSFQGVVTRDKEVLAKIHAAKQNKKPIDGHCPMLTGDALAKYISAGISTEHECSTAQEAAEKARLGMKIMIREGSSAKNMEALVPVAKNPRVTCFLVSDDLHAQDLLKGHVDVLLRKIVSLGVEPMRAIQMATINPITHYGLNVGLLRKGDPADIVVVDNIRDFNVLEAWIDGKLVAKAGKALFNVVPETLPGAMKLNEKPSSDFQIKNYSNKERQIVRVIRATDGSLVTQELHASLEVKDNEVLPDPSKDVLKIAVVERYGKGRIGLGFVNGFGLKQGAIASSVAHDSHNIVAIGTNDDDIARAVNEIRKNNGGIVLVNNRKVLANIPLPLAGLMSAKTVAQVAQEMTKAHDEIKRLGCTMNSPFMTMSFMTMLAIPKIKISDKGLFNSESFRFTSLFVEEIV